MLDQETLNSINKKIRDYGKFVKTNTIEGHVAFLKDLGEDFKLIKSSEFDILILTHMELILDKIIDDTEDKRHSGKIDKILLDTLNKLINLNIAMLRGAQKDKDVSVEWASQLREFIKILKNLSMAALIVASTEIPQNRKEQSMLGIKMLFNWETDKR